MKLHTLGFFLCVAGTAVPESRVDRVPLVMYINGGSGASVQEFEREVLAMAETGVSTIILSFYMTDSSTFPLNLSDASLQWSTFPEDDRRRIVDTLHAKGTKILLSAGGDAEGGKWRNHDATEYGITFCLRAKYLQLDGADFDLEHIPPQDPSATEWLHQSAKSCRSVFPEAIITSAPQSPYLDPEYGKGPFGNGFWGDELLVGAADGAMHNHMFTQYYNQGGYYAANTYEQLFLAKSYSISSLLRTYPNVPKDTFYVGKPFTTSDGAASDWVDFQTLHSFACRARAELGWQGGLMFWQHHWGDAKQLDAYRLLSAPCTSVTTSSSRTTESTTEAPTITSAPLTKTPITSSTEVLSTSEPHPDRTSTGTKFLSSSQFSSPMTETTTRSSAPTTALPSTAVTTSPSDVVAECKAQITATQEQWVEDCRSKCSLYGPGGSLSVVCPQSQTDATSLIQCISHQAPYCSKKVQ